MVHTTLACQQIVEFSYEVTLTCRACDFTNCLIFVEVTPKHLLHVGKMGNERRCQALELVSLHVDSFFLTINKDILISPYSK